MLTLNHKSNSIKIRNLLLVIVFFSVCSTFAQIPTNGLVSYWPFNGNANDESGNGHNAIEITATLTTDRFGNPNSAYAFDGSLGSYIMVPDHDSLDPLNDYTFTFWINPESYASIGGQILNKYRAFVNDEGGWAAQLDPTHLGISPSFWSLSVIQLNTWTFGAIVFKKSTNTCSIYLNGALDTSGTNTAVIRNNVRNLYIGIHEGVSYGNFDGKIDDIRMYNRALSESEVNILFHEGGLVAYYPFSGNADDMSGNSYNGTTYNVTLAPDRFNVPNSAYSFSGSLSSYINTETSPNLSFSNEVTLAAWVKGTGTYNDIVRVIGTIDDGHEIGSNSSGYALANFFTTGTNISLQSSTIVNDGTWHFIAATFSNKTAKLYVDAVSVVVQNNTDDLAMTTPGSITIGKNPVAGTPYSGLIDDVRIYNRALAPTEIAALFNEGQCSEIIYDTVHVQVFDTVLVYKQISVTDTLIVDVLLTGFQQPDDINTLKVYPNPAKDYLIINSGNYSEMTDYSIKIVNQLGATVFETAVTQPSYEINLSTWTGKGVYVLQIYDANNEIKAVKKIILQ
jgi:hypothetical protein